MSSLLPDPDLVLVRAMLEGDEGAWRSFQALHDRLIRRAITSVACRSGVFVGAEDQHEIHRTVLVHLLADDMRRLRSFDPARSALATWIVRISMNCARDHVRALRSRPRCVVLEPDLHAARGPSPLDAALAREQAATVAAALRGFSPRDREFFLLYFEEGLEPRQIADRMGLDLKTVYTKRHKVQRRLESLLSRADLAA